MHTQGRLLSGLSLEALELINLYSSLGENAENFIPAFILEKLRTFVRICHEEAFDPKKQRAEIQKILLELKETIPGYSDVSLMLYPHENSKAFLYQLKQREFVNKLTKLIDYESIDEQTKFQARNILKAHDYSVGTPPVTGVQLDYSYKILIGDSIVNLKDFKKIIGLQGDENNAQWDYLMNVLDQMIIQSTHYTTPAEKKDFLSKTELTVNFRGLSGFIHTVVGGSVDTAIKLLSQEVFTQHNIEIVEYTNEEDLFEIISKNFVKIFLIKMKSLRKNIFNKSRWFPFLSRMVMIDNSAEANSSNTCLVFAFHNGIINTLNKVHSKKLGTLANSQLNLRLILEKININSLIIFQRLIRKTIERYNKELKSIKKYQIDETDNLNKELVLYRFDDFSKQILIDKYTLSKLSDFIELIINTKNPKKIKDFNVRLIEEFNERIRDYFYSGNKEILFATVNEGGGRNQIKTYGEWLLQRKLKDVEPEIKRNCRVLLDILPTNYKRTLNNHFHKNFGINIFLEKYKEYLTKTENTADNKGRFNNFLIDLGIKDDFDAKSSVEQDIIKSFLSDLSNMEKTSISDDVQMIIRDFLFHTEKSLRPYILYNKDLSWEYQDLFPPDRFDLNSFDLEIGNTKEGRIDIHRLLVKLKRMKNSFQLFDDSGSLWDRFCENLTIVINDPSNPGGFTDYNDENLLDFLKFVASSKITLFLDEAYNDAIKSSNSDKPKWRSISRYVVNNLSSFSKINMVVSLSTTKNLGGTGIRLGALMATPSKKSLINYTVQQNPPQACNTNSVFMLVNIIEAAQQSKRVKFKIENRLAKNASIKSIRKVLEQSVLMELSDLNKNKTITRSSLFEGSPLHIFLLNELKKLDKLEVLQLPDDFLYKGIPFFKYYQKQLVTALNRFRINKLFREEANKRLSIAKEIAEKFIIEKQYQEYAKVVDSDGSYLFNIQLKQFPSFQALEKFTKKLAEQRGIAVIPYKIGFLRFALGDYLKGDKKSYDDFVRDFKNALEIFFKYWIVYYNKKNSDLYSAMTTNDILTEIFSVKSDKEFIQNVLEDFYLIRNLEPEKIDSLKVSKLDTLYLAFPKNSGISINNINGSKNSVLEFSEQIGKCSNIREFLNSNAFSKIYENLLVQVYKNIPVLRTWDFEDVLARFGKSVILKYIDNKLAFQPNSYVLDDADELNIMKEILIEIENILFSDSKFKIMAVNASNNAFADRQKLEGINNMLKKYIRELMIHFNLPFENNAIEPNLTQLMQTTAAQFEIVSGVSLEELSLEIYLDSFVRKFSLLEQFSDFDFSDEVLGYIMKKLSETIFIDKTNIEEQLLIIYLLRKDNLFENLILKRLSGYKEKIQKTHEYEVQTMMRDFLKDVFFDDLEFIMNEIIAIKDKKVLQPELHIECREMARMLIDIINKTRSTEYYDKYTHNLIRFVEINYFRQNSAVNEMIQHGISIYKDFDILKNPLTNHNKGALKWIPELMSRCGVISAEQPVQVHTRKVTDAKKREYAYHKVDMTNEEIELRNFRKKESKKKSNKSENDYIKNLATKPEVSFFIDRLSAFSDFVDADDYRCKIIDTGLFKELIIFHKAFMKYLSDNYQLIGSKIVSLKEIQNFVPDVIEFLGAPPKLLSFPKIGYFDLDGPNGKIKTIIVPLDKKADYFGNVKKTRLTLINEKVKEMGGIPVHGSLFAVEEEDGALFVVYVDGDSGVGKSEMLAAMMLKWLKKDLKNIRSIKLIAGDMFHVFPDKKGNIYGIGTEIGDFSRVTDFDPDYIKNYNSLFQSSSDSNVNDLNSRSTIGGLCDIQMPYKIDIILTASNFATEEAGIIRFDNPENFLYYRDSHGERKEKATSSDNPNIQRTLLRYSDHPNIVTVLEQHGNYLDDVLNWEKDNETGEYFLASSFKLIDKIDIEDVVNQVFSGEVFEEDREFYTVENVKFDIIKNRFEVFASSEKNQTKFLLSRHFFSKLFNALASTPSGQPFVSEYKQEEGKKQLLNILRGNYGDGSGGKIVFGVLSTDIGKKGREISGPQKAAEELNKLIQVIRSENPDIHNNKQLVREIVHKTYSHIFNGHKISPEIERYNFYLWQIQQMQKADFVRIDDIKTKVDLSKLKGFVPVAENTAFSPLLLTPNINIELNSGSEIWKQLMNLPNIKDFAQEFYNDCEKLYVANQYSDETIVNNLLIQILFVNGYILTEDLSSGRILKKVNREVLAAAKSAVIRYYQNFEKEP